MKKSLKSDLEVGTCSVISESTWHACSALGDKSPNAPARLLFCSAWKMEFCVTLNLLELLCSGKTFCIPGSRVASHLCQNPAADETASIEKCFSYVTAMKYCYFVTKIVCVFCWVFFLGNGLKCYN